MIRAKNYENLSKFVKVMAKILSDPFLLDTVEFAAQCLGAYYMWEPV